MEGYILSAGVRCCPFRLLANGLIVLCSNISNKVVEGSSISVLIEKKNEIVIDIMIEQTCRAANSEVLTNLFSQPCQPYSNLSSLLVPQE
jgi:hypothetical protein